MNHRFMAYSVVLNYFMGFISFEWRSEEIKSQEKSVFLTA